MNKRSTVYVETRSECYLKKAGAWEYSRHESTEVVCVAYKINDGPTKIFYPFANDFFGENYRPPRDFTDAVCDPNTVLVAHNAFFEQSIFANCFIEKYIYYEPIEVQRALYNAFDWNPKRWRCTAAKARANALPGALEKVAQALKLGVEKDKVGHALMLKLCKPRKTWLVKKTGDKYFGKREDFLRLGQYCMTDVDVEYMVDNLLPNLSEYERRVWELDQKMNQQGVFVDLDSCKLILSMIEIESTTLKEEVTELTLGIVESAAQRAEVLNYVRSEGLDLPNLQAKTVADALKAGGMTEVAKRLLEIRQVVSKTSTAKYKRFVERTSPTDSRVRDLLVYHGPSTGRWSGSGVQPQNFPRGLINDTDQAIDVIQSRDLEFVRLVYRDPMMTFSSCLRGMLTASPGKALFAADYSAIETRVLWWLAGHDAGLRLFYEGIDSYKEMASVIFKIPVGTVTKNQRQLGKKAVLGCGYGMGHAKFRKSCHDEGMTDVDVTLAKTAVDAYRSTHYPVKTLWDLQERAAIFAVKNPSKRVTVRGITWFMDDLGDFLRCRLPSGRILSYPYPILRAQTTPWGEVRPVLCYWGMNSFTRKWEEEKTYGGKFVENLVQAIARDIMVNGMFKVEEAGYSLLITVHDELVAEAETGSVEEFEKLITDLPAWANGCPIAAEGWTGQRYKK